jgi:hypothetical protein
VRLGVAVPALPSEAIFAHRAFCARLIFLRAKADRVRLPLGLELEPLRVDRALIAESMRSRSAVSSATICSIGMGGILARYPGHSFVLSAPRLVKRTLRLAASWTTSPGVRDLAWPGRAVADGELPETVYRWVFKQRSIPALTALRADILDTQGRFGTVVGMFSALKAALRHVWKVLGHPGVFGVGMPVLLGVGLAMTYGGDFALGICVLILAALWSASFWLDSSLLKKKNPRRPRPRISDYEKATSVSEGKLLAIVVGKRAAFSLSCAFWAFQSFSFMQSEPRKSWRVFLATWFQPMN